MDLSLCSFWLELIMFFPNAFKTINHSDIITLNLLVVKKGWWKRNKHRFEGKTGFEVETFS